MIKLINNEIYKIFHKKGTIIVLATIIVFEVLFSALYKTDIEGLLTSSISLVDKEEYQKLVDNFNPETDNYEDLVYNKTMLELITIYDEYDKDSWQVNILYDKLYDIIYNYYYAIYLSPEDTDSVTSYNEAMGALKADDWKYFVNQDIATKTANLNDMQANLSSVSEKDLKSYNINIKALELQIAALNQRLSQDIIYSNDYLNNALDILENSSYDVASYEYATTDKEKASYEGGVKNYYENKYVVDTLDNTNDTQTLRYELINFISEYFFLILLFIIIIAGSIVSDEFSKGTIKSLLVAPYKREKILLAKYITTIIMLLFVILYTLLTLILVGGIFFGFDSLSIPVVVYNLGTETLEIVNIFKYVLVHIIAYAPELILLGTLAFAISTIFNSTALAIALTLAGYIGSSIINMIASSYNIDILNYFVTTNWDFSCFLYGGTSPYGNSLLHAIIVCGVYYLVMLIVSFVVFKKENIKNI